MFEPHHLSARRLQMGLVIFTGLSTGTLFTLFVVPAAYLMLAADRNKNIPADSPSEPTRSSRISSLAC